MDKPTLPELTIEKLCHVANWAADCAERALPVFEARAPNDARPRQAIDAARAFARSGVRTADIRKFAWGAQSAAKDVQDPAAAAAARAASTAAATAYTHPIATSHQTNHILSSAAYAAHARALSAGDEPGASDAEIRWAIGRASPEIRQLVQQFPARAPSKGRFHTLLYRLDTCLRS
ncbi:MULTISPECIES: putative immunity protein [unclassified Bradyrhizobium]